MAIITISRGSYSKGKEIAEKVAERLGYKCIARRVLFEASDEFNVPEVMLTRAIHDAPSFFANLSGKKEKYVSFIQAEILEYFRKDNVVYHGLAGHFFVKAISHVLKVRIIADLEDRVTLEMEREGISREEALSVLLKDDEERVKWGKNLYGIDTRKANIYDLVIHIHKLTVEDAVDMICHVAGLPQFQTTPESQRAIDGLALAARVKAALVDVRPDIEVTAEDGIVLVKTEAPIIHEASLVREIQGISKTVAGVKETKINIVPSDVE
jgi:cytidylate kinase